jgi:hypothetical protein
MRRQYIAAATLVAVLMITAGAAQGDSVPPPTASYSGAGIMRMGGQPDMPFRVNAAGPLERREMVMQGSAQTMIKRPDLGVIYMLMPQMGQAMEMPLDDSRMPGDHMDAYNPVAVGGETVLGEDTAKYRMQGGDANGSFDGHAWITGDGIMMRMEGQASGPDFGGPVSITLNSLQRGPQDPSLFELPPGTSVMQMPGSMPGGGGGGAGGHMENMPAGAEMPDMEDILTPEQMEQMRQMQEQMREQMEQMQRNQ